MTRKSGTRKVRRPYRARPLYVRHRQKSVVKKAYATIKSEAPDAVAVIGILAPVGMNGGGRGSSFAHDVNQAIHGSIAKPEDMLLDLLESYKSNVLYPIGGVAGRKILRWAMRL